MLLRLKGQFSHNQKYPLFLLLVLFIHLDCSGVSCPIFEISAVEMFDQMELVCGVHSAEKITFEELFQKS